jgi:putative NIF3 family GTP cyclohydrolase 1 type 2
MEELRGMNTCEMMEVALKLAGLAEKPGDTDVMVPGENIQKILIGIDMDTPELLLARELGYDCVVSHHPRNVPPVKKDEDGPGDVMDTQVDKMVSFGVPRNKAQKALAAKKERISFMFHSMNSGRSATAAILMNMPFMCIHTPADMIGEKIVQDFLDEKFADKPETTVGEIMKSLDEIPEYERYMRKPVIRAGSEKSFAGKIAVLYAGGTGGGPDVYKAYFEAGVGTLVLMHAGEDDAKSVKEQNIGNILVAGHMSSDSIGINRIIAEWEKRGVTVTRMSGVVDVS